MKIHISNYNNISDFEYEIEDGKINFLFAISGSGKSSIAKALTSDISETNRNVENNDEEIMVKVDDNDFLRDDYKIFDSNYVNDILIDQNNKGDVYSIIVGDKGEIDKCKTDYLNSIKSINSCKSEIIEKISIIDDLYNSLSIQYNNDGSLHRKSKLIKFDENVKSIRNYNLAKSKTAKEINWISEGVKSVEFISGKCPFCNKELSDRKISQLSNLSRFDAKDFEIINSNSQTFDKLNIKIPDWKNGREKNRFYKNIKDFYILREELKNILHYITIIQNYDLDINNLSFKTPSKLLKNNFISIYNGMLELKDNFRNIKKTLGKLKSETNKVISNNIDEINNDINILGLKYRFEKLDILEDDKKANYKIVHIKDIKNSDMRCNLSTGEKSIIGLLFFLIANKNSKNLIIDDPASSYDEYRRKVIFDLIYKYHKSSTILVLSHDHVFAKYALFSKQDAINNRKKDLNYLKKKYLLDTGRIDYLEAYDKFEIKNITCEDFHSLNEYIKEQVSVLGNTMDYRKAINLRILFEQNKQKHKIVYSYLSAIMHKTPYYEIKSLLEQKNIIEENILDKINEETKIKLEPLKENYIEEIKINDYTDFEKLIAKREDLNRKIKKHKIIYDELSNIIHLNNAYAICLNPYKFNYFSRYVYNYIKQN